MMKYVIIVIGLAALGLLTGGGAGEDEYARHVKQLRVKAGEGFTVVEAKPFVVVGDEAPEVVARRAEQTVKWAVKMLKRDYFAKDPERIIDVWLFRDKASYEKGCRERFGHAPTTPYGFYSDADHAMVMNIATGGGTLVHEIVHPFMAANFPECPAWFNEGMGSLYEQSGERDGHIIGHTNWRLAGLQKAIEAKTLLTFEQLCGTSDDTFYGENSGIHYAQARYLCYYLQERGLLTRYYRQFVEHHEDDPTGYATLKRVIGEDDMTRFQKKWEQWVSMLRFP